jgi:non-heme chloroperoxidase
MSKVRLRDGREIRIHRFGSGPTVVMLHGFGMHGRMWLPSVLPLATRFRFVMPDLRGFGDSHRVPYAHRDVVRNHAEDVSDVIAQLGESSVRLCGLSMGALTALALAESGGFSRVSHYVHVDQAALIHNGAGYEHGLFGPDQPGRFADLRSLLEEVEPRRHLAFEELSSGLRMRMRAAFATFCRSAFKPSWLKRTTSLLRHERLARLVFPVENWTAYVDCLRAYLDEHYDFRASLADSRARITVMVGEASEMYPAEGQLALAESWRRAEVVRFPGVGHSIPLEAPVAFSRALGQALR